MPRALEERIVLGFQHNRFEVRCLNLRRALLEDDACCKLKTCRKAKPWSFTLKGQAKIIVFLLLMFIYKTRAF